MQRFDLVEFQFRQLIRLIDRRLFRRELRFNRIARERQSLRLDLVGLLTFLFFDLRSFVNEVGHESVLGQLIVRLAFHLRLLVRGMRRAPSSIPDRAIRAATSLLRGKLRFRGLRLRLRFVRALFEFRTGQLQYNVTGFDFCSRPDQNFFDAGFRRRRDPANVFRNQRAESAHLAHHRTAFHGVDPNARAIDARRRRFQTRQSKRRQNQTDRARRDNQNAALALFRGNAFARNIHGGKARRKTAWPHDGVILVLLWLWGHRSQRD